MGGRKDPEQFTHPAVVGLFSLFIAGVLRNTLLAGVINQFYATDTSSWTWVTAFLWEQVLPIVVITVALVVIITELINDRQ